MEAVEAELPVLEELWAPKTMGVAVEVQAELN